MENVGVNPGHVKKLDVIKQMEPKRKWSFIRALKGITRNRNLGINITHKLMPQRYRESRKSVRKSTHKAGSRVSSGVGNKPPVFAWVN